MFKNRPISLRMFSADAGFTGEENPAPEAGTTNALGGTAPAPAPAENPAWHEHLEKFPNDPAIRHIAKEVFSDWDKQVQGRFNSLNEKYKPYGSFIERGVDPKRLESAYGVAEMLEADPKQFALLLAQELGLSVQEAQAATEALQQTEEVEPEEDDPRLTQIQQQQQQFMEWMQAQEQQRLEAQTEQQMNSEFAQLEQQYGTLIPEVKNEVLREALRLSHERNAPVSMVEAYQSLEKFVSAVRSTPRPGQIAPRTMPSGGSQPLSDPGKRPGQMTPGETKARAAEVAARLLAQSQ